MNLKILCSCGTKFSFDVEPLDGKMPVNVFCPGCGVDVTDSANASIQQTPAAESLAVSDTSGAKPRVRLHVAVPDGSPSHRSSQPAIQTQGAEMCHRHARNLATEHCIVCKKPICPECMQSFGYLCSINCRYRAEQEKIRVPVCKLQRNVAERGVMRKTLAIAALVGLLVFALVGAWFWYILSGSKPKPFYTLKLPANQPTYAQFLGPDKILLLRKNEVALHDIKTKKDLWSIPLEDRKPDSADRMSAARSSEAPPSNPGKTTADPDNEVDADYFDRAPAVATEPFFIGNDVWLCLAHRAVCIDLKAGTVKYTVPFQGRLSGFTLGESALLIVSEHLPGKKRVTQIALANGEAKRTEVASTVRERALLSKDLPSNVLPTAALLMKYELEGAQKNQPSVYKASSEFFPAGQNLVEMQVKLVEIKITSVQTMKAPGPSNLGAETRASTSSRAVLEEISNEMKRNRGGGTRSVDESRYVVTLRRPTEPGATDWSGEVISLPVFFPQKTVDVLVAGKTLYLFDKQNKKIAESQMQYPVDDRYTSGEHWLGGSPCVEAKNSLFVFDKGVLTAFDLPGATVRWRLPSVGISRIQFDERGMLYVSTTTGAPEDIQYSEQIKVGDPVRPIVLKVDPKSGKTLWKSEQFGDGCFLTGKYLYLTDASRGGFAMANAVEDAFDAPSRSSGSLNVYRVDPSNGKKMWSFTKTGAPSNIDFFNNRILLHYSDEIEIMKFISF